LTAVAAPGNLGSVTPASPQYFSAGSNVNLTATPNAGQRFLNWTGPVANPNAAATQITMNAPQTVTANFAAKLVPDLTWADPAPITFGSALSAVQLNAGASVAGTFVYSPAAGTVLPVGNGQVLSVTFTPTDTVNYTPAAATAHINVLPSASPALAITRLLSRDPQTSEVLLKLTIANTGGAAATNLVLKTATIAGISPSSPALPTTVGTIPAGGQQSVTLRYPASIGASGAAAVLSSTGTYAEGTLSLSARIVLP
jgi:hypothetical protein